jgi:hypothetical protein
MRRSWNTTSRRIGSSLVLIVLTLGTAMGTYTGTISRPNSD